MPHHFAPLLPYAIFVPQAIARSIERRPAEVKFYTNTLRYNQAYWVTVDRLERHNEDARFDARFDDGKPRRPPGRPNQPQPEEPPRLPSLTVTTTNIEALTLRPADVVPKGMQLPLHVDGQPVLEGEIPDLLHLARGSGSWKRVEAPERRGKSHGVQGPMGDAFLSPFLAVYGDGERELAVAELDALRNPPGQLVIHCDFPMKSAARVTPRDIASSNLILFGTPSSNAVLRRVAPSLPSRLVEVRARCLDVIFVYPNPESPERYAVVWTGRLLSRSENGLRAGYILPVNLLPDYALFREGKIVSAGHFDSDWKLREPIP